jgi:hypothetical protein
MPRQRVQQDGGAAKTKSVPRGRIIDKSGSDQYNSSRPNPERSLTESSGKSLALRPRTPSRHEAVQLEAHRVPPWPGGVSLARCVRLHVSNWVWRGCLLQYLTRLSAAGVPHVTVGKRQPEKVHFLKGCTGCRHGTRLRAPAARLVLDQARATE